MAQPLLRPEIADWLNGLRLVSSAEKILINVIGGLIAFVLIVALLLNASPGLVLGLSHAVLAIVAAFSSGRQWTWRVFGLIVLSLVHTSVFLLMAIPGIGLLAWIYAVVAVLAGAAIVPSVRRQRAFMLNIGQLSEHDDFRWAVTAAPLALRFELSSRVSRAMVSEVEGNSLDT